MSSKVRRRHMVRIGAAVPFAACPWMASDATPFVENFDRVSGQADIHLFTYELVWDAVVGFLHLDVIVNVHDGLSPTCEDVAPIRQWVERGPIEFLVEGTAGSFKLLEGLVVKPLSQLDDGSIQVGQTGEDLVAAGRQ